MVDHRTKYLAARDELLEASERALGEDARHEAFREDVLRQLGEREEVHSVHENRV